MGRRDRHERLRAALRRARRRDCSTERVGALPLRLVALGLRRREPAGAGRERAGRARSTIRRPRTSPRTTARSRRACERRGPRGVRRARARSCARGSSSDRTTRPIASPTGSRASLHPRGCWASAAATRSCPRRRIAAVQFIDARDLADWMLDLAAARIDGTFNACSPPRAHGRWARSSTRSSRARNARAAAIAPRGSTTRSSSRTTSCRGPSCRCGFPHRIPRSAGFMSFSCARALAHGLRFRPLAADARRYGGVARAARQRRRVAQRALGGQGATRCWPRSARRAPAAVR